MTLFTTRGALGCFPFLVAGLAACVPVDASKEITLMSDATATLSDETLTKLKPQIDAYKAAAPDRAAAAGDLWLLSQACDTNEEVFNYDALSNCRIDRVANETAPEPAPTQLQAVQRKLGLLSEYSALLSDLASAQTEADINRHKQT